ncbi:MAG: carboxypeptidase-like regulatory domain-containing protein, partial [Pyrinomonadaceae bacterium]
IGGTVTVTDQAAPSVEVSGKVLTPDGRGLRNTQVTITDKYGVARTVTTSSFGTFRFDAVTPGETYTIAVTSKRYRFASRQVTINDNQADVDFSAQE